MFKVGKLYKCTDHCFMVYPTKEIAANVWMPSTKMSSAYAFQTAEYLSKQFDCKVQFINLNDVFMCLKSSNTIMQILCGEFVGWIRIDDWFNNRRLNLERVGN